MPKTKPKSVEEYLASLPAERREALTVVRKLILKHLPKGYQESFNWGMIAYEIPLERYPKTYNGQPLMLAALASQKNYMSIHLVCVYGNAKTRTWLEQEWKKSGKKLDMGKGCLRFRKLEDLSLPLIGKVIAQTSVKRYIQQYEAAQKTRRKT